jgi:hypothetical protein
MTNKHNKHHKHECKKHPKPVYDEIVVTNPGSISNAGEISPNKNIIASIVEINKNRVLNYIQDNEFQSYIYYSNKKRPKHKKCKCDKKH